MAEKYNLENSVVLLENTFNKSNLEFLNKLIKNIIDSEDFSDFSRYTKNLVVAHSKAFVNRLVCYIWLHFGDDKKTNSALEKFYQKLAMPIGRQLHKAKLSLLEASIVSDSMTDVQIASKLESFFKTYESKMEFLKLQNNYVDIKKDFEDIIALILAQYSCGADLVDNSEVLLHDYLKNKEKVLLDMGLDVRLEYHSANNFNLVYNDPKLLDPKTKGKYERKAVEQAIKLTAPGLREKLDFGDNT